MKWTRIIIVVGVLSAGSLRQAEAALYALADPVLGAGALTRDPASLLDWLDLPLSKSRTYNDVANELGAGGDFAGFRHATIEEVTQLFLHGGIQYINETGRPENNAPAVALIALVGATSQESGNPETRGFTSTVVPSQPTSRFNADLDWLLSNPSYYNAQTMIPRHQANLFVNVGHWLVRPVLAGDYNLDGEIDHDDYVVWRSNFGSLSSLAADGNFDGKVDAADYVVWRNAVALASRNGTVQTAIAPEPSGIVLLLTTATVWHVGAKRTHGRAMRRRGSCLLPLIRAYQRLPPPPPP